MPTNSRVILIAAAGWHDESPGGANRLPTEFARYLAGRGYRVVYLCASAGLDRVTTSELDGVELRRYPAPTAESPSVANVRRHWAMTRAIVRAVQAEQPIAALLGHAQLQYLAATTACARGVRRCYGAHSPLSMELETGRAALPSWRHKAAWRVAWLLEARLLAVSDLVHCYSHYTRRFMEAEYPRALRGRSIVLPGWVDTTRFRIPNGSRDDVRARLGGPWEPGVPTFFTLRRLMPRMGIDTFIEATAALARAGREFRVIIAGEGPERRRLEEMTAALGVAHRVRFVGRIAEQRLTDSYAAADCFVLPTRALECFGLIVLEAYACGVPVIGVPVGAIPEVMGAEFAPWIAEDNRAGALARRMDDVLAGRLTAEPTKLRARALQFDMGAMAEVHEGRLLG